MFSVPGKPRQASLSEQIIELHPFCLQPLDHFRRHATNPDRLDRLPLPQPLITEASMLTIPIKSFQPWISLWTGLSAAPRRLAHRWVIAHLHCRTLEQLATLSDHQLRDLGFEESPYREGALRDACNLKVCPSDRWASHFLPETRAQRWL